MSVVDQVNDKNLIRIALITSFIQFTNALEYMMFNPIFIFMAKDFGVSVTFAGYVTGIYTLAAVISGGVAFFYIDRFNKKFILLINMAMLGVLTLLITQVNQFYLLLLLRFLAGLMGGTTMGVGISLLINATPTALRSKMLAIVIASFSIVSIVGMPGILFLCEHYGWHSALWLIFILCLLAVLSIKWGIPNDSRPARAGQPHLPLNRDVLLFASGNALIQFSPMLIIPILVPVLTQQLQVSNKMLPWLFFIGGISGYWVTKITGTLMSRYSATFIISISTLVFVLSLLIPLVGDNPLSWLFMILFLGSSYSRLVASSALTIQFPEDKHRAGYGSLQTALMYLTTTLAFFLSSILLPADGMTLQSLRRLLILCALSALVLPFYSRLLQHKLNFRLI
ncbi:MFS transporter [Yersinia kristensenii]|uniref:MFS transporter n=1 Tax=Yersinia kristensenii TaxID=28152 RepID=UPI0005E70429|nr:MFS transporter [Yersinia kristensenii]CFR16628.1 mxck [Yersinia kristensenii]